MAWHIEKEDGDIISNSKDIHKEVVKYFEVVFMEITFVDIDN